MSSPQNRPVFWIASSHDDWLDFPEDVQDVTLAGGDLMWHHVAKLVAAWGADLVGESGLSSVGAVVGATQIPGALRAAGGAKAAEAAEGLRATMTGEAGKAIETETASAAAAETESASKAKELVKHEAELARIEKARAYG